MTEQDIIGAIKRYFDQHGEAPGKLSLLSEMGIRESDWRGKYWTNWPEAVAAAGLTPNQLQEAYSRDEVIDKMIELACTKVK
jgi:hypothetical protein